MHTERPSASSLLDAYFIAAVVGSVVILSVSLLLPLGYDNSIYQSMGYELAVNHRLPYLGSWDQNFPGIVYIHALAITLFGNTDLGFRLLDVVLHTLSAALFYRLLIHWIGKREALFAMLLLCIYYVGGGYGLAGQRDGYAVLFILAALISAMNGRNIIITYLLPGVLIGIAIAIRPTYLLFAPILMWKLALRIGWRKSAPWFALGVAIPWLLILLPYAFYPNGLRELYHATIRFNLDLYSNVSVPFDLFTIGRLPIYLAAAVGFLPIVKRSARSMTRDDRLLIALLGLASLLSVIAMRKFFTYHFEPFMAIMVAFAAHGVYKISKALPSSIGPVVFWGALLAFAYMDYPRHLVRYYFEGIKHGHALQYTYETVQSDPLSGLKVQNDVIGYLNRPENREGPIEYCSLIPNIRWRASREEATRFTTLVSLAIRTKSGAFTLYQMAWQCEFLDSLASQRTRRVIIPIAGDQWSIFVDDFEHNLPHKIPGFDSVLAMDYKQDTVIGGYAIYRHL